MSLKTTAEIAPTLGKVLRLRTPQWVGCAPTWGELKAALDRLGVQDGDTISSFEFGIAQGTACLMVDVDDNGFYEVKEQ